MIWPFRLTQGLPASYKLPAGDALLMAESLHAFVVVITPCQVHAPYLQYGGWPCTN
jgi:hypothetical protein